MRNNINLPPKWVINISRISISLGTILFIILIWGYKFSNTYKPFFENNFIYVATVIFILLGLSSIKSFYNWDSLNSHLKTIAIISIVMSILLIMFSAINYFQN